MASQHGVRLALLNASMTGAEVVRWHSYITYRRLLSNLLAKFDLIVPMSDLNFGHFCLFGAEMRKMPGWCGDLKHASALGAGMWYLNKPRPADVKALRHGLHGRPTWVASHTAPGEEDLVARVHKRIASQLPRVRTVLVPGDAMRCSEVRARTRVLLVPMGLWSVGVWTCGKTGVLRSPHLCVCRAWHASSKSRPECTPATP